MQFSKRAPLRAAGLAADSRRVVSDVFASQRRRDQDLCIINTSAGVGGNRNGILPHSYAFYYLYGLGKE